MFWINEFMYKRKLTCLVRDWIGRRNRAYPSPKELENGNTKGDQNFVRMDKQSFEELLFVNSLMLCRHMSKRDMMRNEDNYGSTVRRVRVNM